jgi:hypothetical protein
MNNSSILPTLNRLKQSIKTTEQHMRGHLFHEGEYGAAPEDFVAK